MSNMNVEQKPRDEINARIIELLEKLNVIPIIDSPETQAAQAPADQKEKEHV